MTDSVNSGKIVPLQIDKIDNLRNYQSMIEIDKIPKENKKNQSCPLDQESTKYDRKWSRFENCLGIFVKVNKVRSKVFLKVHPLLLHPFPPDLMALI